MASNGGWSRCFDDPIPLGWWTLFFAGFPLALTAAVISWHLFEYPVLKFRNSFVIKRRPESGLGGFVDTFHAANSQSAARTAPRHGYPTAPAPQ